MPGNHNTIAAEASAFMSFTEPSGINISKQGEAYYLELDDSVTYPEREPGTELHALLLQGDKKGATRHLELPDNFVTMTHALNDAIGDNTSEHSKKQMEELFEEVGSALGRVAMLDLKVPVDISYKNIVFSREHPGVKLLPPIRFTPFSPRNEAQAKRHTIESFQGSLRDGAANTTQLRHVDDVFSGFTRSFGRY